VALVSALIALAVLLISSGAGGSPVLMVAGGVIAVPALAGLVVLARIVLLTERRRARR